MSVVDKLGATGIYTVGPMYISDKCIHEGQLTLTGTPKAWSCLDLFNQEVPSKT